MRSTGGALRKARLTMSRYFIRILVAASVVSLACAAGAVADIITLHDGTVIEGTIVKESATYIRVETATGDRSFFRRDIQSITRATDEGSADYAIRSTTDFARLDELARQIKNAEALYAMHRYDDIPGRVEPLLGKGTRTDDSRIHWLLIESYERQGNWETAESLLHEMSEKGSDDDKIRAKAHLDIFADNPGHTLRKVGKRRAKEFLSREMRNRGRYPDALKDRDMMEAALLEYIDQILKDEKISVFKLEEDLDVEKTLQFVQKRIEDGAVNIVPDLPYLEEMQRVKASLDRVNAILPGFADGFQLNLVRIDIKHVAAVMDRLSEPLMEAFPNDQGLSTDGESNRLTADARKKWREECDAFLKLAKPEIELNEYVLQRARRYPTQLKKFIETYEDALERIQQMTYAVERNRDRAYL